MENNEMTKEDLLYNKGQGNYRKLEDIIITLGSKENLTTDDINLLKGLADVATSMLNTQNYFLGFYVPQEDCDNLIVNNENRIIQLNNYIEDISSKKIGL